MSTTRKMSSTNGIRKAPRPKFTLIVRRLSKNADLALKLSQMRLNIAPIVHVQTGLPAPDFPRTMLHLFTLTESQLDSLAHFYSQSTPSELTNKYPLTMDWTHPFLCNDPALPSNCRLGDLERIKIKMRMFARFIGMKGAETPKWEYDRQVEILRNKIERDMVEEESSRRKFYAGPGYAP